MIKVVIVDDEIMPINQLSRVLKTIENISIVDTYTRSSEALEGIKGYLPDIVFLDIEMPGMSGIEMAKKILKISPDTEIIFVTAYQQYALEAFDVYAMGYLLKPIRKEAINSLIKRNYRRLKIMEDRNSAIYSYKKGYIINCFGKLEILFEGEEINLNFRSAKIKSVFAYYIHNRKRKISREELLAVFWSEMCYEKALSNLNTTNYHIKKILKECTFDEIQINYTNGYYQLILNNAWCEIDKIDYLLDELDVVTNENFEEYMFLFNRLINSYLEDVSVTWKDTLCYYYENKLIEIGRNIAEYFLKCGDVAKCVKVCQELIDKFGEVSDIILVKDAALTMI